jgi:hypothetical protein
MKMIKILQGAVVAMFILMVCVGLAVLFFATEKMTAYLQLIGGLFPIFLAQVIPALVGSPMSDYIRARAANLTKPLISDSPGRGASGDPNQGITG